MNGWGVRVIALLAVVGSYWLVYQHGRSVERAEAEAASAIRDSGDRLLRCWASGEPGERNSAAPRHMKRLGRMLRNNERLLKALLLGLMLLASGCATKPANSPPPSVAPARIPPLPLEARQPAAPPWCSPTCSHGLMHERESWRQRLTAPE